MAENFPERIKDFVQIPDLRIPKQEFKITNKIDIVTKQLKMNNGKEILVADKGYIAY